MKRIGLMFLTLCLVTALLVVPGVTWAERYFDASAAGANNGTSWANAYTSGAYLGQAIAEAAADPVKEVRFAAGAYTTTTQIYVTVGGMSLLGGYAPGGATRNPKLYQTIIQATPPNGAISRVLLLQAPTTVSGLTLTGGRQINGGGIGLYFYTGSTGSTVEDCVIVGNYMTGTSTTGGSGAGVGISASVTSVTLRRCVVAGNGGVRFGGGIGSASADTSMVIEDCIIAGNYCANNVPGSSASWGGGMTVRLFTAHVKQYLRMRNTIIAGNWTPSSWGAGMDISSSTTADLSHLLFYSNMYTSSSVVATGGVGQLDATCLIPPNISNTIFAKSQVLATTNSAGQYAYAYPQWKMHNSLFDVAVTSGGLLGKPSFVDCQVGEPLFYMDVPASRTIGLWTSGGVLSSAEGILRTTLTNASAGFAPNSLKGRLIMPNTVTGKIAYVWSNTATTVEVQGDFVTDGANGAAYKVMDWRTANTSPAVDRALWLNAPDQAHDIAGNPRPVDVPSAGGENTIKSCFDIGPFENQDGEFLTSDRASAGYWQYFK